MQKFKTISFPKEYTSTNKSEFIKLAFNLENDNEIYNQIADLRSSEIRELLGNPTYDSIIKTSEEQKRSINNQCLYVLKEQFNKFKKTYGEQVNINTILANSFSKSSIRPSSGTFKDNRTEKIHRWYPYVEGYSYNLVQDILQTIPYEPRHIYDPFSGTGTTQIVASHLGIKSSYSEINPFMRFVIDTKVNDVRELLKQWKHHRQGILHASEHFATVGSTLGGNISLFEKTNYSTFFKPDVVTIIEFLKTSIKSHPDPTERNLLKLALMSIVVEVSNMTRRADLRYKTQNELDKSNFDVISVFHKKVLDMLEDIDNTDPTNLVNTKMYSEDAKQSPNDPKNKYDLVITSPPYVNGTNYFRNTKLELLIGDFIQSIDELPRFCSIAVTAGINNVSSRLEDPIIIPEVEHIVSELEKSSYDTRIPKLVRHYFSDMQKVFINVKRGMSEDGLMFLDIGDSQFAGVHVPADELLATIGERAGFDVEDRHYIRQRYSKNGMKLKQVLLKFRKRNNSRYTTRVKQSDSSPAGLIVENYSEFQRRLPYRESPYSHRNWGHGLHSLCSYQGKLKPAIAHYLVKMFSNAGMTILDPLGGVGTIPLEACLNGRKGISNDLSRMSYGIALAKLRKQDKKNIDLEISRLARYIKESSLSSQDIKDAQFGFNKTIPDYYHPETLNEIIKARKYFSQYKTLSPSQAFVLGCVLHILHGNRPYALSRRSHSITPFAPRGEFEYKNLIQKLSEKTDRMISETLTDSYVEGESYNLDFSYLPSVIQKNSVDVVITSPPFYSSTRFYLANWIRMWFCGWNKEDFEKRKTEYLETKQMKDFEIYKTFFETMKLLLKKNGTLIMHLGKSGKFNMGQELMDLAENYFEPYGLIDESVTHIEKFGVKDQGSTKSHQYLFLINRE